MFTKLALVAAAALLLILIAAACGKATSSSAAAANAKLDGPDGKAPERQPLWTTPMQSSAIGAVQGWVEVLVKNPEAGGGAISRYLDLKSGAPVDNAQAVKKEPRTYRPPAKETLGFDEFKAEEIVANRVIFRGSHKPEGGRTSHGLAVTDRSTGALVWRHWPSSSLRKLSAPVVLDGVVYFVEEAEYAQGAEKQLLYAFALESGEKKWTVPVFTGGQQANFGYIAVAAEGKLWVRGFDRSQKSHVVIDAATGAKLAELDLAKYGRLTVRDGVLYAVGSRAHSLANEAGGINPDTYLIAFDAMTGQPLWRSPLQVLSGLSHLTLSADGSTIVLLRTPVAGQKQMLPEAVLAFQAGR